MSKSFITAPGDPKSSWILHVPHSSTRIPGRVRARLLLDDDALQAELRAMTDAHTDVLAREISARVTPRRPWSFINRLSRLVVDPERFSGEREVMDRVGMGAVYTRTSSGVALRAEDPAERAELISTLFEPYGEALADLVDDRLVATDRAVILALHSYPREPLPYELYRTTSVRPSFDADERHTPPALLEAAREPAGGTAQRFAPARFETAAAP